jgi:hypothetical protein
MALPHARAEFPAYSKYALSDERPTDGTHLKMIGVFI